MSLCLSPHGCALGKAPVRTQREGGRLQVSRPVRGPSGTTLPRSPQNPAEINPWCFAGPPSCARRRQKCRFAEWKRRLCARGPWRGRVTPGRRVRLQAPDRQAGRLRRLHQDRAPGSCSRLRGRGVPGGNPAPPQVHTGTRSSGRVAASVPTGAQGPAEAGGRGWGEVSPPWPPWRGAPRPGCPGGPGEATWVPPVEHLHLAEEPANTWRGKPGPCRGPEGSLPGAPTHLRRGQVGARGAAPRVPGRCGA